MDRQDFLTIFASMKKERWVATESNLNQWNQKMLLTKISFWPCNIGSWIPSYLGPKGHFRNYILGKCLNKIRDFKKCWLQRLFNPKSNLNEWNLLLTKLSFLTTNIGSCITTLIFTKMWWHPTGTFFIKDLNFSIKGTELLPQTLIF